MATERSPRLRFDLARLSPRRWPVRSRIAAVSAGLTLIILVAFALVIGRLATDQIRGDFQSEISRSANELAASPWNISVDGDVRAENANLSEIVASGDAVVQLVDAEGNVYRTSKPAAVGLGPPSEETERVGDYAVTSRPLWQTQVVGPRPMFVQYARSAASVDRTVSRLWLFLGGGVLGGTILAALAGLAVAGRAMRPIASLTATAREIATTRDPSKRIPTPESRDEVAELARTLEEMLRELDAARSETEQMIQAQREFVADASHELRTPLTSILANLELLEASFDEHGSNGEEAEIVGGALRSSQRMRRLVSDLLLLARADAGRTGARRECDLAEIAASAHDEVRAFASDHELTLDAPQPVSVVGTPDELHRLIVNLLENGVRHTPAGTGVRLAVAQRDGNAVLEVTDDGPGLPEGTGDQVFARFFRANGPADVSGDSGTGLGLAIVRAVAESHSGTVDAGSAPQGGARFTIRLPLAPSPAPAPAVSF